MSDYSIKEHAEEMMYFLTGKKTPEGMESFPMVMAYFENIHLKDDLKRHGEWKRCRGMIVQLNKWIAVLDDEVDWFRHNYKMISQDTRIYSRRDDEPGAIY